MHEGATKAKAGKRTGASRAWRVVRWPLVVVGVLLLPYLWQVTRMLIARPTISDEYEGIIASVLQPRDIDPALAAWPKYVALSAETYELFLKEEQRLRAVRASGSDAAQGSGPKSPDDANVDVDDVALAGDHPEIGARIRGAAQAEVLGAPVCLSHENEFESALVWPTLSLESTGVGRAMVKWLGNDARAASKRGDTQLATDDLCAMLVVASHIGQMRASLSQHVALTCMSMTVDLFSELVMEASPPFTDVQLRAFDAALANFGSAGVPGEIDFDPTVERLERATFLEYTFTDDGRGDGRVCAAPLAEWVWYSFDPAYNSESWWRIGLRVLRLPYWSWKCAGRRAHAQTSEACFDWVQSVLQMHPADQPGMVLGFDMPPDVLKRMSDALMIHAFAYPNVTARYLWAYRTRREAARALVGAARFRVATGQWPSSLEGLVPEYLATVPIDIFDGKPMKYRAGPEGLMLYLVGLDGVNDGGAGEAPSLRWWETKGSDVRVIEVKAK